MNLRVFHRLIARLCISTGAFYVAAEFGPGTHTGDWQDTLLLAFAFAAMSVVIMPIVSIITALLTSLTLGLYIVTINVALLYVMQALASAIDMVFEIDKSYWALLDALIIGVIVFVCTVQLRRVIVGL